MRESFLILFGQISVGALKLENKTVQSRGLPAAAADVSSKVEERGRQRDYSQSLRYVTIIEPLVNCFVDCHEPRVVIVPT